MAPCFSFFKSAGAGTSGIKVSSWAHGFLGGSREDRHVPRWLCKFVLLSTQGTFWLKTPPASGFILFSNAENKYLASSSSRHLGSVALETIFGMKMSPKLLEVIWKF